MSIKRIFLPFIAAFIGFTISPSYSGDIVSCDSFENCPDGSVPLTNTLIALQDRMDALEADITALEVQNAAYRTLLAGVTRIPATKVSKDTLRFSNMNVQIVNGSGTTDGTVNGTGNLIIGYNELRDTGNVRTGSHMLVVGSRNNYSAFGGMVAGSNNTTSGIYSSVSGGNNNTASGPHASVSGGWVNFASSHYASVSGGSANEASGPYTSISGGYRNSASNSSASVSGGRANEASGQYSSVSGGDQRTADNLYNWVAGSLFETN